MILLAILIAVLIAENICLVFYFYTRPDRAIRLAEKDKTEFIRAAAMKLLNRAWGVQGAPAMDDEFEDATPPISNRALEDLMPEEAQEKLEAMREELETVSIGKRSQGSIARRRELVGDIARYERSLQGNPVRPKTGGADEAPYMNTLEPNEMAHLSELREN